MNRGLSEEVHELCLNFGEENSVSELTNIQEYLVTKIASDQQQWGESILKTTLSSPVRLSDLQNPLYCNHQEVTLLFPSAWMKRSHTHPAQLHEKFDLANI